MYVYRKYLKIHLIVFCTPMQVPFHRHVNIKKHGWISHKLYSWTTTQPNCTHWQIVKRTLLWQIFAGLINFIVLLLQGKLYNTVI